MNFVRIDLQITEEQAREIAPLLDNKLVGFSAAFNEMIRRGVRPGKHYGMLYRSEEVQKYMQS